MDDEHAKGTILLYDIYYRCNIVVMELAGYDKAVINQKWIVAMIYKLKVFEKNQI